MTWLAFQYQASAMAASNPIDVNKAWSALLNHKLGIHDETVKFAGDGTWAVSAPIKQEGKDLLDLYTPFIPNRPTVIAHLGQSMDGFIATENGASHYITGPQNILHLHRMRALSDAILVGSKTVCNDDPQLTTRLVHGPNPIRIVIDPKLRLPAKHHIFTKSEAPTLILAGNDTRKETRLFSDHVEIIQLPISKGELAPELCLEALISRGLCRIFIEGGGHTISRFFNARAIDHLQIAVAPVFLGAGKAGLRVPPAPSPNVAVRNSFRSYHMGDDILYDYKLATS
jgi:diaminohydroxyphosphoribosylaminopyrimidine deaminase/5-amino-6-(5-phosphoribosylamino)uracil reductase